MKDMLNKEKVQKVESLHINAVEEREIKQKRVLDHSLKINEILVEIEDSKCDRRSNIYALRKRLLTYYKNLRCLDNKTDEVKELYKSIFDFLFSDFNRFFVAIGADIKELDICYASGAYKATLIMAGSILEWFLLDWLSEIDEKNYFEEPYQIQVLKNDGRYEWEKREQLSVYIDQIEEINHPDWMDSSEKAHFIRKNRNSVHAKVCLRQELDIDKDTCKQVIMYLKEIVDSRLDKRRQELCIF